MINTFQNIEETTHRALNAPLTIITPRRGFIALYMMYLLVFIHLEDTILFSPSRYVKSLLPSPLSVPSPFDERNERHYPRKFRSLTDKNEYHVSVCHWSGDARGLCVCDSSSVSN